MIILSIFKDIFIAISVYEIIDLLKLFEDNFCIMFYVML